MNTPKLPPLPEWTKTNNMIGLTSSEIQRELQKYALSAIAMQGVPEGADAAAYRYCHRCGYKSETVVIHARSITPQVISTDETRSAFDTLPDDYETGDY